MCLEKGQEGVGQDILGLIQNRQQTVYPCPFLLEESKSVALDQRSSPLELRAISWLLALWDHLPSLKLLTLWLFTFNSLVQ